MSRKKTFDEFLNEANQKHKDKMYMYDKSTYINTHTPMRIVCPKHGEFWQTPKSHLLYECLKCSYEKRAKNYIMTTQEFIEKANKIHGIGKYSYEKAVYKGTKEPICIICSKHGEFWQKPNNHLSKKGCPKCHQSQLEREVERFLTENNIEYKPQYKTEWLGRQSLDFYLPDYNVGIECQGKQHFGVGGWGKNFDYQNVKRLDIKKYKLCNENGINLYYLMNIKNKSYITEDIIYIDRIFFNIKDLIDVVTENKKGG